MTLLRCLDKACTRGWLPVNGEETIEAAMGNEPHEAYVKAIITGLKSGTATTNMANVV